MLRPALDGAGRSFTLAGVIAMADSLVLKDAAATEALGARLGAALQPGDCVCLWGGLGAGKTTLARGAISAWMGAPEEAPSPTFTLVQIYESARGELWHLDLYRLKHPDEAFELGLEDAFVTAATLIEWPERLGAYLPKDRLDVRLSPEGDGRRVLLEPQGKWERAL